MAVYLGEGYACTSLGLENEMVDVVPGGLKVSIVSRQYDEPATKSVKRTCNRWQRQHTAAARVLVVLSQRRLLRIAIPCAPHRPQ